MEDDACLLHLWFRERDQSAFSALVTRYAGLVFGTALRRLGGNRALAEEAAQNVFTLMAAKAESLIRHPSLAAWLHRAAMWQAATLKRNESTHTRKLNELAAMIEKTTGPAHHSSPVLSELDAALARLGGADRRLLLMRYFEQRNFREIARHTGLSEAAAQKQASRALQRLTALMHRRGVTAGAAAISTALPAILTQQVPAALAGKFASAAAAVALSKSTALLQTLSLMAYGKKSTLTAAAVIILFAAAAGGFILGRQQAVASLSAGGALTASGLIENNPASESRPGPGNRPVSTNNSLRSKLSLRNAIANASRAFTFWGEGSSSTTADPPPLLRELEPGEFEEALRILPELKSRPDSWESAVWFVFSALATEDPARAASVIDHDDFLRDGRLPQVALQAIAVNWADKDLPAAIAWLRSLDERNRGVGPQTWGQLMAKYIRANPGEALAAMGAWPGRQANFESAFRSTLAESSGRDALINALDQAGDQQWLTIAGAAPDDPAWLSDHFVPWLFSRKWNDSADAARLCERILNRGTNPSARLAAVCQSLGVIASPDLASAVTDELLPVLKNLPEERRQQFLDRIDVPALRERLATNF